MAREYVHQELGKEINSISGYYVPLGEKRMEYNGKEVLCVTGAYMIDNSCCGRGGCTYAIVPGYVVNWETKKSESGLPVSEVEPINDKEVRREIAAVLKDKECAGSIEFWSS
ncbi:MAG: hypothetical protein U9N44_05255 [Chloroflexota bacterium]|nr:hypothetical protein [Chloroflexota bacterium]